MFAPHLRSWRLVPDGDPIVTPTGRLLPVRRGSEPAMLKLLGGPDECRGAGLMAWWDGNGAARVLARTQTAVLMERATGARSLADMARTGRDAEACRTLCDTASLLHPSRAGPHPALMPLGDWFRDLEPAARKHGGLLRRCAETAGALLREPRDVTALHGDLHHDNVLDFGARGWLAIDPKGLVGERGFEFATLFRNPDLTDPRHPVATDPARFARRVDMVAHAAMLEHRRLLRWILASAGLSAAWFLADDDPSSAIGLAVAGLAARELDQ